MTQFELAVGTSRRVRHGLVLLGLAGGLALSGMISPVCGQARRVRVMHAMAMPAMALPAQGAAAQVDGTDKAILKTDADLEALLDKAERYLAEGNIRIATRIWQEVIGRCGDTLFSPSPDGEIYYSIGRQVEKRLAQLSPDGLRTYRIAADAGATEILAALGATDRTAALNRVVNEYFMSSLGDDCAFELAGMSLDELDFVGAGRLLRRIVDDYPDPSVSLEQVWIRIAVCQAYIGNRDVAAAALQQAKSLAKGGAPLLERVADDIAELTAPVFASPQQDRLAVTRLGNARRTGVMPALPEAMMQTDLRPMFQYRIEPKKSFADVIQAVSLGTTAVGEAARAIPRDELENTLYKSWERRETTPTGYLLFDEQHVYFKSIADVTVWDKSQPSEQVVWRPAWLNQFVIDEGTRLQINVLNAMGRNGPRKDELSTDAEIFFLGDRIAQAMSLYQGVFYNVEGPSYDMTDARAPQANLQGNFQFGQVPRRARTNFLTAYDARTGQLLWRLPAQRAAKPTQPAPQAGGSEESGESETDDIGFMEAPIGFGPLLIAPVNVAGSVYVYALDSRQQGRVVWRTYLTDEPAGGSQFWSPIQLTLDGSDLFVACGSGVLFVLEPATGVVRFARRYPRTGKPDQTMQRMGLASQRLILDGWDEDIALPYHNAIVVLASDLNMIHAYDRQTGALIWEAPTAADADTGVRYLLGVLDDILFAGGANELIAYDLKGEGRMIWTGSWTARDYLKDANAKSYGRGMVTPDAVYFPVDDAILKFNPSTGKPLGRVGVRLGYEGKVGNLYSDGERIWVINANRLLALENVPASENEDHPPAGAAPATPPEPAADDDRQPARPER